MTRRRKSDPAGLDVERDHIRRGFLGLALCHELKQPLHSANLNVELVSKRLAKLPGAGGEDLKSPLAALSRVVDRINDSLDAFLARVSPEPVPSDPQPIVPILEAAVERARRAGAKVELAVADDLPEVPVHPEHIAVALDALLDNARRAGGEITVSASEEDEDLKIEVRDTGMGMAPDVARRAVEIGFSTWGGAGVGVTVAKFITYHHGGGFQVSSAPGEGTAVTMNLPGMRD